MYLYLQFLSLMAYSYQNTGLSPLWIKLIPWYFMVGDGIVNCFLNFSF